MPDADEVLFRATADLSNVDRLSEEQLDALLQALDRRRGKAKDAADKAQKPTGGRLAGAGRQGGRFALSPVSRLGLGVAAALGSRDVIGSIVEVAGRAAGDALQKSLPQFLNPALKALGIDKESIGRDIGSAVSELRESSDQQIARVAAVAAATSQGLSTIKAAGGVGVQVTGEQVATFAFVDYQNSMIDAQLRDRQRRRAERRATSGVIEGLSEYLGLRGGQGR